ncbi:MAG: type II toxin-antitoxin system RelE/ParE family toxin [Alcaligenaceae bacterium]|nr:type II toxin-antitoxin system RelE/ParE family toxin [Alcaligenaceae bacterium SAGV5]MPS50954.1 type II toxin-antitoxin system RelE/ParE family toxin [Alcaligenaceae bacterium SAGV3]MPT55771.1 type II toxin-antitoxin system RelE/ParE family toxin [Alcaligenaceae bacterium]
MNTILATKAFEKWLYGLKDLRARARIIARIIARIQGARTGNFGSHRALGRGVMEMKIDVGPGYRIYYARQGSVVYLLLCGGDKSTQACDIKTAHRLWATREVNHEA